VRNEALYRLRNRPELDPLLAEERRQRLGVIAVAILDTRQELRHLVALLDELQHLGVGLVSLSEAFDLTSPIGRAMYACRCARRGRAGVDRRADTRWLTTCPSTGEATRATSGTDLTHSANQSYVGSESSELDQEPYDFRFVGNRREAVFP
jgi:Resolvase, N terminal domain